jgi:hypothetical protein
MFAWTTKAPRQLVGVVALLGLLALSGCVPSPITMTMTAITAATVAAATTMTRLAPGW